MGINQVWKYHERHDYADFVEGYYLTEAIRLWPTSLAAIRVLLEHGANLNATCSLDIMETLQCISMHNEYVLQICMSRKKITNEQKFALLKHLLDYAVIKHMSYDKNLKHVPLEFIAEAYRHGHSEVAMTLAKLKHTKSKVALVNVPHYLIASITKYAY